MMGMISLYSDEIWDYCMWYDQQKKNDFHKNTKKIISPKNSFTKTKDSCLFLLINGSSLDTPTTSWIQTDYWCINVSNWHDFEVTLLMSLVTKYISQHLDITMWYHIIVTHNTTIDFVLKVIYSYNVVLFWLHHL